MISNTLRTYFLFSLLFFAIPVSAGGNNDIEKIIEDYVNRYNIPGIATVITKDDEVIYNKTQGMNITFNTATTTYIASVSKPITATAIMILVERGQLNLESPITDYLSELKLSDGREHEITIEHLLNHTSGLSSHDYPYRPELRKGLNEIIADLQALSLATTPGSTFSYTNTGYQLLGIIIERVSGMTFHDFITQEIFTPLGMNSSSTIEKSDVTVDGYTSMFGLTVKRDEIITDKIETSAAFILSSATDISKFLQFQSSGRDINGNVILSESTLDMMHSRTPANSNYALGWMSYQLGGVDVYGHDGILANYSAQAIYIPNTDITISILINKNSLSHSHSIYPQLLNELVSKLHKNEFKRSAIMRWIILIYPLLIILEIASNIFGIKKLHTKHVKTGSIGKKQLFKELFSSTVQLTLILAIPIIAGFILNRGLTYFMMWYAAPDLAIWMAISVAIILIKIAMLGQLSFRRKEMLLTS